MDLAKGLHPFFSTLWEEVSYNGLCMMTLSLESCFWSNFCFFNHTAHTCKNGNNH